MLSKQLTKRHFILKKGHNLHIALTLLLCKLLHLKLCLYKRIHRIRRPVVHYYAVCWNEASFLPFMLEHYKNLVDHFYIYDNGSNDDTLRILDAHPRCSIRHFDSDGFNDRIHIDIKNDCWKQSRGKADYVIVCDIDELLFHPDPAKLLDNMHSRHQSILQPQGYDMYSDSYPDFKREPQITLQVTTGIPVNKYSKCILFDPYRIVDIHYDPGCHQCHPIGMVHYSTDEQCKLLHYKNLGLDYLLNRTRQLAKRLSDENLQAHYGCEYLRDENEISAQFRNNLDKALKII